MTRKDIRELRVYATYPALTIVLPCDKDRIHSAFVDMVKDIDDEQLVAGIKEQFCTLYDRMSCPLTNCSIAVFVHARCARFYTLPCVVPEIVECDDVFKLDTVVSHLNRMQQYWVIDFSQKTPALCIGYNDVCLDVIQTVSQMRSLDDPFYGTEPKTFDELVRLYVQGSGLPICCVGPEGEVNEFLEYSPYADDVVRQVSSRKEVWKAMQLWFEERTQIVMNEIAATSAGIAYHDTYSDIYKACQQGMIRTLLVEEDYVQRGCYDEVRHHITLSSSCPNAQSSVFAVDAVIEGVRARGGEVVIAAPGVLSAYGGMVATLIR